MVLIGGSGPTDRDETVAGIPVFGQIARDLVAAGFVVVRYDKRGVGQSGGRAESVTIADYAEDARQVVLWLEKRKDVDKERMALVGHSEGALVAMLTAGRERGRVSAHRAARRSVDERQRGRARTAEAACSSKMPIDDAQRAEKMALQEKINTAVIKGTGWADLPEAARRVADTPWFYSFLTFDPEKAMNDTRQPVLIVQGELDTQVQRRIMPTSSRSSRAPAKAPRRPSRSSRCRASIICSCPRRPATSAEYGIARPRREGVAASDVGDRDVPDEGAAGVSRRPSPRLGGKQARS